MSQQEKPPVSNISADLLEPPSKVNGQIIKTICFGLGLAILWSYLTPVTEVASGTGKVIPDRQLQAIQSVEGGYIDAIFARSGDLVEMGELLVRLDPQPSGTPRGEVQQQLASLAGAAARLRALQAGTQPEFAPDFARDHATVVASTRIQFAADQAEVDSALLAISAQVEQRRSEYAEAKSQLATVGNALKLAKEELGILNELFQSGAASRAEVLASEARHNEMKGNRDRLKLSLTRLNSAINELSTRRDERMNMFKAKAAADLNEVESRMASLNVSLQGADIRLARTEIRAPMSGILKSVHAKNVGQVIKPYEIVAEIVPASDTVLVQARLRPEDIGFVAAGMPAIIKLTAYDYSIFGALTGKLEKIAADSTTDERGNTYYEVDVRADKSFIERRGEQWPVKSGMVANVEIVTGSRSILQYLTKPIHRMATMALRER